MPRSPIALKALCVLTILVMTLPVLAAAVRGRPHGPYKYTLIGSNTFRGQTETVRERGRLTVSGRRVVGRSSAGDTSFNLKFATRLTRAANQNKRISGRVTINHSRYGINSGRVSASFRIQKTRVGTWKTSGNYTGRATRGRARGATINGRFRARSI